jgi:hypothetical protein
MDISSRFSLTDFLAYLFPGIFFLTGLYFLLLLTPLKFSLQDFTDLNLTAGILFLAVSFIFGVIISGFAEILTHSSRHKDDIQIPLDGFEKDIRAAFSNVFGKKGDFKWTRNHFYLCRSMVIQHMPYESQGILRQSSLRQLRMNMLPSIAMWLLTGLSWSFQFYRNDLTQWGIALALLTIISGIIIILNSLNRMQNNDKREVRETLAAFLVGYKTGMFNKK